MAAHRAEGPAFVDGVRGLNHAEAVDRAAALAPAVRARREQTDMLRRIPDATVADVLDAGLFGLATPRAWNGAELWPETWLQVTVELASACGSTGWFYGVLLGHMWLVSQFPPQAQAEVFGDPRALVASLVRMGGAPPVRVNGGYHWRGGRGRFCTGIDHAGWVVIGGALRPHDDGAAEPRWFLVPRSDIHIVDDWFTVGLQGTGSKSIELADAFIPEHRSVLQSDVDAGRAPGRSVNIGALYRLPGSTWAFPLCATSLGLGRQAVRVTGEALRTRHQAASGKDGSAALATLGAAATEIEVAAEVVLRRARRLREAAEQPYNAFDAVVHRRDIAFAVQSTRRAVNRLMEVSSGSGVYAETDIQRLWRDCNVSAAHASFGWEAAMTAFGRALVEESHPC